jgi:hypothetical protein
VLTKIIIIITKGGGVSQGVALPCHFLHFKVCILRRQKKNYGNSNIFHHAKKKKKKKNLNPKP